MPQMTREEYYEQVLSALMAPNDARADTIRGYLKALLLTVWQEGEGFSGKRPFGNSGWEDEIYETLVSHEFVEGTVDDDGNMLTVDEERANILVSELIDHLFAGPA